MTVKTVMPIIMMRGKADGCTAAFFAVLIKVVWYHAHPSKQSNSNDAIRFANALLCVFFTSKEYHILINVSKHVILSKAKNLLNRYTAKKDPSFALRMTGSM